ncbi:MAG: hypothetical protein NVSMB22_00450 [Chloroflexota bacterium]
MRLRSYSPAVAAIAIGAPRRWVGNVINQHRFPGLVRPGRGNDIEIPSDALLVLAVVMRLSHGAGLPVYRATEIAKTMCEESGMWWAADGSVSINIDLDLIRQDLARRLVDAVESPERRRRGRRKSPRTTDRPSPLSYTRA